MPAIKATGFLVGNKQNIADSSYPNLGFVGDCWILPISQAHGKSIPNGTVLVILQILWWATAQKTHKYPPLLLRPFHCTYSWCFEQPPWSLRESQSWRETVAGGQGRQTQFYISSPARQEAASAPGGMPTASAVPPWPDQDTHPHKQWSERVAPHCDLSPLSFPDQSMASPL